MLSLADFATKHGLRVVGEEPRPGVRLALGQLLFGTN